MIIRHQRTRIRAVQGRPGFTILELLLASVAAAMLMSALYFSMDMTITQTQAARDNAGREDVIRGIFNRFALDMGTVLAPQPAQSGGTAGMAVPQQIASASSATSSTGGTSTGGTSTGGTSTGGTGTGSSSSSSSSSTLLLGSGMVIPLQSGVIGGYYNTTMLVLFTSRVPDLFTTTGMNSLAQQYNTSSTSGNNSIQVPTDLHRVVYWLGTNGGLYRQESPWPTSVYSWNLEDLQGGTLPDDPGSLVAEDVKDLLFEFYDPYEMSWGTYWDGTGGTSPPYSMQPGPPPAIRVTLTFEFNDPKGGAPIKSQYIRVFPIMSAAGQWTQTLLNPTAGSGGG